jgi:hypothetical protein
MARQLVEDIFLHTWENALPKDVILKMKAERNIMAHKHSEELKARDRKELGFFWFFLLVFFVCSVFSLY